MSRVTSSDAVPAAHANTQDKCLWKADKNIALAQASRRLCFVGLMIGRNPGYVTTQEQIVADLFAKAGYPVVSVSASTNRYLRLIDIVRTLIRQRDEFDVMVLAIFSGPSFVVEDIASLIARRFNKRVIMFLHGGAMPQFMARFPRWTRRVLGRAEALIAPSSYLSEAIAPYGFTARIIPNVVDLSHYEYRPRKELRPRLFWMRSFEDAYNPSMAVRVLARLRLSIPEATLVMAGQDKGLGAETRRLAEESGVADRIRFPGFLTPPMKAREGSAADIFINTNRIDNMPVGIIEAGAMGLPVVATAVGGIPHLLKDGETGLLVADDDADAMAEAIKRLLSNSALAARLSAGGRRLAERCAWENVRTEWERLFEELMTSTDGESAAEGASRRKRY